MLGCKAFIFIVRSSTLQTAMHPDGRIIFAGLNQPNGLSCEPYRFRKLLLGQILLNPRQLQLYILVHIIVQKGIPQDARK